MSPDLNHEKQRIFYGWYIIGAAFLILFFNAGARFSIGVIFKPLITEFGWSRTSISFAVMVNMAVFALSLTVIGKTYDRFGPKWVIIVSTLILAAGFVFISFVTSFWQFLLFFGFIAAIGTGGTSVPIFSALTSKWFEKKRGLAISLALAGNSMGQFVLVPLLTKLVTDIGWRASFFWIALIMLLVNIALTLLVIKGDPHDLGKMPYGSKEDNEIYEPGFTTYSGFNNQDLNLVDAMRTPSFWFYTIVMLICGSGDFLVTTHLIPFVTDYGVSPTTAGNMLALFGLMSLVGMMVAGPASDRIGNKIPLIITFLIRVLLFVMIINVKNTAGFYIFSLFFGFTFLITAPLTPNLIGRLYGITHVGILSGFITTIHHLAGGVWAYAGGALFDYTGSYQQAFYLSAVMAAVATLCCILIKEKRYEKVNPDPPMGMI
ncbi:MFS transporter [Thermodesulfobacteriota bacterium]